MIPNNRRCLVIALAGTLFCVSALAGRPGSTHEHEHEHDHERAREALERGEVRPLAEILARVAGAVPGDVVEVEFEHENHHGTPRWMYEIKLIAKDGHLVEVMVDAATARIVSVEED